MTLAGFCGSLASTIENLHILSLGELGQLYNRAGKRSTRQALRFAAVVRRLDLTPYDALKPAISLDEKNPPLPAAQQSGKLDWSHADAIDDDTLNRILWRTIKGDVPYPGTTRAPVAAFVGN